MGAVTEPTPDDTPIDPTPGGAAVGPPTSESAVTETPAPDGAPAGPGASTPEVVASAEPVPTQPVTSAAGPAGAYGATGDPTVRRQNRVAALGLIVLVVALAFGGGFAIGRASAPHGSSALAPTATPAPASPSTSGAPGSTAPAGSGDPIASLPSDGPRLGSPDAPVTIEYWADYQCPFCARFALDVIPQLVSRIADGSVALVHRDFAFLGQESIDAAVAVRCAGQQGLYWPMHDAVYAAQNGENQGTFSRAKLQELGTSVGVDPATFTSCLDERGPLVEVLDDTAAGVRAGVTSTPTVDVNGTRFPGVSDVNQLYDTIDAALAGATPGVLPTQAPINDPWASIRTSGLEAGDPAAQVTVELWMDYQAPASAALVSDLEPELQARLESGAARAVLRDLALLGDESVVASSTVRCIADQGGPAWLTHDVLAGAAQGANSGVFTTLSVLRFASRLGLDVAALSDCLDDPTTAAAVRSDTATGTALGLTTGPAVVVKVGDREVARFEGEIDAAKVLKAIDGAG
jgi:protein-disulfide isomerase